MRSSLAEQSSGISAARRRLVRNVLCLMLGALLVLLVAAAPRLGGPYVGFVVSLVLINALATMGVNISMGYAGLVSVGHAGFAGIGAYATVLLMQSLDASYWLALPAGAALAGIFGVLIGVPTLRLNSLYIAMITFGFGQAVNLVLLNWVELTHGPNGIVVPPVSLFGTDLANDQMHIVLVAVFIVSLWLCWNLVRSRLGRALLAIKGNEIAAESMGIPLARYKVIAFGLGAFLGGLSGGLYAGIAEFINPDAFTFGVSINYLTMSVVGGLGTFAGPIIGAALLTVLPEILRSVAEFKETIFGVILLLALILMPDGIAPRIIEAIRRSGHSPEQRE